ncbi:MAG: TonB family protein [Cyclobacteriaceae bacterium]
MNAFVNYFLEANIGLLFFYTIYWMFLRNENQFTFKRSFLLGALIASLLFPLLSMGDVAPFVPTISHAVPTSWLPEVVVYGNVTAPALDKPEVTFSWTWIYYVYTGIATVLLVLFLIRIASLISLFKKSQLYKWKSYTIAESDKIKGIFSFFNVIFFNPKQQLGDDDKQEILRHEEVHIQRLHSLDTLLIQLIGIVFWFNPIVSFYKKSLVQLHEFEADARSVKDHDVDRYCHLLAKVALQNNGYVLANHFTNSFTLKRITMMKTIRTKIKNWKVLALATTLPLFFLAVACQDQIVSEISDSTISQLAEFPPEAKADIAIWEAKQPGGKYNYVEGSTEEMREKLNKYTHHAILNTYTYPDREVTGLLLKDLSSFELKDSKEVFTFVEDPAKPKEGIQKYQEQLAAQIKYPEEAKEKGIEGKVYIEFVVDKDGTITDPRVQKGADESLNKEALRVVSLSQPWSPGRQRGKTVKQRMVLPITFSLRNQNTDAIVSFDPPTEGAKETMKVTGQLVEENGDRYMVGQVLNSDGKPTAGMNIVLEGTNKGTVSDRDGTYRLKVNESSGRLTFSFIGYETEHISF